MAKTITDRPSMPALGEGRANRFVPIGGIDSMAGPTPPYIKHHLRLIGD